VAEAIHDTITGASFLLHTSLLSITVSLTVATRSNP
jgi:hypothetical protein